MNHFITFVSCAFDNAESSDPKKLKHEDGFIYFTEGMCQLAKLNRSSNYYLGISLEPERRMPEHEKIANRYYKQFNDAYIMVKGQYTVIMGYEKRVVQGMIEMIPAQTINRASGGLGTDYGSKVCYLYCCVDKEGKMPIKRKEMDDGSIAIKWVDPNGELRQILAANNIQVTFGRKISVSEAMQSACGVEVEVEVSSQVVSPCKSTPQQFTSKPHSNAITMEARKFQKRTVHKQPKTPGVACDFCGMPFALNRLIFQLNYSIVV